VGGLQAPSNPLDFFEAHDGVGASAIPCAGVTQLLRIGASEREKNFMDLLEQVSRVERKNYYGGAA